MQAPSLLTIGILVLVAWRVYARIRRMVGRQRLSPVRPWVTVTVFSLVSVLLASTSYVHPERLAWLLAGLVCGGVLSVYGLRMTKFEATPQGFFYTPNAHLGIALSLLFVARIAYRLVEMYGFGTAPRAGGVDFVRSPLTLAVYGLLAGYYVGYAIGLLCRRLSTRSSA